MMRNNSVKVAVLAGSVLAVLLVALLLISGGSTTALASPAAQGTGTAVATVRPAATVAAVATAAPTRVATVAATATAVRPAALPTTGDTGSGPNWLLLVGGALLVAGLLALLTLGNRAPQRR